MNVPPVDRPGERALVASVLLSVQAALWFAAAAIAIPFGIVEPNIAVLAAATFVVTGLVFWVARGVRRRRRWARRSALIWAWAFLVADIALGLLPAGSIRGPVPFISNILLPAAVMLLLRGKKMRLAFAPS
jgi:hypothetical protein